ncbi:HD domain-containing protein [Micromonospora sp. NPDC047762]|uniref:HD domain-containing protein n=1 Tax=Micromonospora sp. NPDC047762 TaxID=3364255 RepID=UPI003721E115
MKNFALKAEQIAGEKLSAELPRRWLHVQAVASKARQLGPLVGEDLDTLVAAAWLHDIGYAREVVDTGFHSLDGARWLLRHSFGLRIAGLVAYHSCASYEADERGLSEALKKEFPFEESTVADTLWYADMTTGPDGQNLSAEDRLAEIRVRYGPEHLVTRFWRRAEPALMEVIRRTRERIADQPM